MHLWTLVRGQVSRTALANPLPPSVTTTSGAGIGAMRADHALEFSDLAMYQETTLSPLQHMSTTRSRATQIPSTWSTRCSSPSGTGMGQTSQNSAVLRLKDRPPPGIVACESFERSHPRNSSSLVAVSSYLTVVDAPQAVHLHRWDPDEVLPVRLVRPPQSGP